MKTPNGWTQKETIFNRHEGNRGASINISQRIVKMRGGFLLTLYTGTGIDRAISERIVSNSFDELVGFGNQWLA